MGSAPGYLKKLWVALFVLAMISATYAQTYKVNGGAQQTEPQNTPQTNQQPSGEKSLGWGSNIQNARLARAAEQALKNGQYAVAVDYAQRAADAAPNDPQLWFLLGYTARLAGKSQLSIEAFNHGLKLDPSSLDGISGLAQTYARIGKSEEAERLLTQVLSADPKRTTDAGILGELYLHAGQYDKALAVLGRAEQYQPDARTELLMAIDCEKLKKFDQANRYLEMAKKRAPNNVEVLRSLAGFYRETGNYSAAISTLKGIARNDPDIQAELAYTYQLSGKKEEAAKVYAQAAKAAPQKLDLQLSAAQSAVAIGQIEAAEPFLKRATALDEDHYRLHAIKGEIARLQEDNAEAVQEYNAALAHLPQSPPEGVLYPIQLHMSLVELYRSLDHEAESHRHLEIAQSEISGLDEQGPSRAQFLRLRALVKSNAGDVAGAENDIREALAINPNDPDSLQQGGDLLVKTGHPEEAIAIYRKILGMDPVNKSALVALGYVSRETGNDQDAEKYFRKLAAAYPKLYIPYLAMGDMYAARRDFSKAEASYRKAHELSPKNALAVAGGMNAAIEAHHFDVAADWLKRATPEMQQNAYVMREKERYLSFTGKDAESAEVARQVIKKLPKDRDVVVYLGYNLLHLERYDELLQLTSQYEDVLPKEPDIPLLQGYVHKHNGDLEAAEKDFSEALRRDSRVPTAYVNRGFVFNDTHRPAPAAADFEAALKLEPKNGEAHLGLAYATLELHRPRIALKQVQMAEQGMGESLATHLIRATAYGEEGAPVLAAKEYRSALKYAPHDPSLHLALGETLYGLHHYSEAITEEQAAQQLSPKDSAIYAALAQAYAQLHDRNEAMQNVSLAEQHLNDTEQRKRSGALIACGEALNLLGERDAAMSRFAEALALPNADRIAVRLAVARLMTNAGQFEDARRQVALAFMEARSGETLPPTGEELLQAADVFLGMHDFQLAQTYFQRALAAGASESSARIGLANSYLAVGDTARAQGEIASIANSGDNEPNYQYLMAQANVYRQRHQNAQALTAFAQAAQAAGEDQAAQQELMQVGGDQGMMVHRDVSVLSDFSIAPIFEDTTVYPLDAKLDVLRPLPGKQSLLPLPRSSLETQLTGAYHLQLADLLHLNGMPEATGFFQVRNARGEISLPSADTIVNRDTTDYSFNFGLNPTLHLGTNVLSFNTGIQETIQRDSLDPVEMNQNLFRQFVYMSTSSFFNLISVSGWAIRETGPFTLQDLHSRDLSGALDFRIGAPWGKTAFVTGWGARDLQFTPINREFYFTSAYAGIEHQFGERLKLRVQAEDLRAWRVEINQFAIAQALRPAASVEFKATRNWSFTASTAYSRNMGFHAYDAVQSGFAVSYALPIRRTFKEEGANPVELRYPIRFSAGMQQEDFYNFTQGNNSIFRPYVSITIF